MNRFSAIPSAAVEDDRLSGADLNVLVALGYHTCKDGWCWPSQDTIAKKARLSRQFVVESMKRLIRWGYVERYIENNNTRKIRYRVILDLANAPAEAKPLPVVAPVVSPDIDLSPHTTGPVVSHDKTCRVTRHKQEPTNYSKEQDAALRGLFEEIWGAWSRKLKAGKTPGRGDGKAKTFTLFQRKAAKTDPAIIRTLALDHVSKAKLGYLGGLSVWLNGERYDTGDNVVPIQPTVLTTEEKLYAFEQFGRWDAQWGPKPGSPKQPAKDLFHV
jgi:DNA-binding MarR family transcriptional regulator